MSTTTRIVKPWDRVGVSVPIEGRLRALDALRLTSQDWGVEKVSMVSKPNLVYETDPETGERIKDEEKSENVDLFGIDNPQMCMTVRVDRDSDGIITNRSYLGTVGKGYGVVQNLSAVEFFDDALGPDAACITAVGSLGKYGARFFMVASLPDMLEVVPGEPLEQHILFTNSHDGSSPVEAKFVAWNPNLNVMLRAPGGSVRLRHTKNVQKRVKTAHQVLHSNHQYWERAQRAFAYMARRDVTARRVDDFLAGLFPDIPEKDPETGKPLVDSNGNTVMKTSPQAQRSRDALRDVFEENDLALPHTDWGLFNAVAVFVDHRRNVAKSQRDSGISRWEISVFGAGEKLRNKAYTWLKSNK